MKQFQVSKPIMQAFPRNPKTSSVLLERSQKLNFKIENHKQSQSSRKVNNLNQTNIMIIVQIQQRLKWQKFLRYWHQPKNVCKNSNSEQNNFSKAALEGFQNTNVLPPVLLFFVF